MTDDQRGYRSYLLRLWQAGNGEASEWRLVIEDVRSRKRQSFASVNHLATFLRAQMRGSAQEGGSAARTQLAAADAAEGGLASDELARFPTSDPESRCCTRRC
jgi:hypothetical protein